MGSLSGLRKVFSISIQINRVASCGIGCSATWRKIESHCRIPNDLPHELAHIDAHSMSSSANLFTVLFLLALGVSVALQLWLAQRQVRHVNSHLVAVPAHFAGRIALAAHQKAADYTIARTRLSIVDIVIDTCVL